MRSGECHPAEPLIGGNEQFNLPELAQFERNSEPHCIKGAEAFRHTELNQESPCALKVAFVDRWGNKEALPRNINPESTLGDLQRLFIDLHSP